MTNHYHSFLEVLPVNEHLRSKSISRGRYAGEGKEGGKTLSLTSINERFRFSAEGDLLLYLFLLPASNNFKPFH